MSALKVPSSHVVPQPFFTAVRWDTYERLVEDSATDRVKLTYDTGKLEITAPLPIHESEKRLVGRLIETLTAELDIPLASFGFSTCKRADLSKGLEPDERYYIQNAHVVPNAGKFDSARNPPPDLAIEMEVTRSWLDRRSIYAALGVPEVWTYDGERLAVLLLADGKYVESGKSAALPMLPLDELRRFLALRATTPETTLVRGFQKWVRENLAKS